MNKKYLTYFALIAGIVVALFYAYALVKSDVLRFFSVCFVISLVVLVGANMIVRKILENYRN